MPKTSADELRSRAIDSATGSTSCRGRRTSPAALSRLEASRSRATAAEAGDDVEERMARAKASLEEVNQKWARVQALVTDRCN